jgi:tRNA modification GTPase
MGIEIALSHVKTACDLIAQDAGAELASEDVRLAARALAGLVGEIGVEEILGAVFSEFCIGK